MQETTPRRLGFAVKVLGRPDLKSNDARRWQSGPHLRVSLGYLREIFDYLDRHGHPDVPDVVGPGPVRRPTRTCRSSTARSASAPTSWPTSGRLAREQGLRLSFHPSQFVDPEQPRPEADGQERRRPRGAGRDPRPDGAGPGGGAGDPRRRDLRRPRRRAAGAGPRPTRRCPSRSAAGWCWRTTTSASARPTSWRSTRRPASP